MKIHKATFALAGGLVTGTLALVIAVFNLVVFGNFASPLMRLLWPGFGTSVASVTLALPYGAVDGFVICWLIAALYNWLIGLPVGSKEIRSLPKN